MSEEQKKENDHEVTDEELEDATGGVISPITPNTKLPQISDSVDGESSDDKHKEWIDI